MATEAPHAYKAVIGGAKHRANLKATLLVAAVVVVLVAIGGGVYAALHKDSDAKDVPDKDATSIQHKQINAPKPGAAQVNNAILSTHTFSGLGQFLSDPSGSALYTYDKDKTGVSNCSAACLETWPVYVATATSGLPKDVTVINRTDGRSQYAYKGKPLYYFIQDSDGLVTGDGQNGFHVAQP